MNEFYHRIANLLADALVTPTDAIENKSNFSTIPLKLKSYLPI